MSTTGRIGRRWRWGGPEGDVGAGGGRRRHSRGSGATERPSESGCGGRKGEMRVRVGVRP
jgi:hypothetical protein